MKFRFGTREEKSFNLSNKNRTFFFMWSFWACHLYFAEPENDLVTPLILSCSFHSHQLFFDKVKIKMQTILSFFFCLNYALSVITAAGNTDFRRKAFLVHLELASGHCIILNLEILSDLFWLSSWRVFEAYLI